MVVSGRVQQQENQQLLPPHLLHLDRPPPLSSCPPTLSLRSSRPSAVWTSCWKIATSTYSVDVHILKLYVSHNHTRMQMCRDIWQHTCIMKQIHEHTHMHACMDTCVDVHEHAHTHTHTHTHAHTHTHTHTQNTKCRHIQRHTHSHIATPTKTVTVYTDLHRWQVKQTNNIQPNSHHFSINVSCLCNQCTTIHVSKHAASQTSTGKTTYNWFR